MSAAPVAKLSVEEYLAIDRAAEVPSEYHNGEMFPVASVSWVHSTIDVNLTAWLKDQLAKTPCRLGTGLRVRVSSSKFIVPDIIVVCGKPALTDEHHDTVTNPKVIIEILSPSTSDYDYGEKFSLYRRLPSFEEYLLVSQASARAEVFRRSDKDWVLSTYEGLDTIVPLESVSVSLPLAKVYEGVDLPATEADA
jgi:Uma2 family endonuclease